MGSSVGIVSMGAYLPAKTIIPAQRQELVRYLRDQTHLPGEYIEQLESQNRFPGKIETNFEGWASQPWFDAWLAKLPPKKRGDPFQGTKERRRVPLDPVSVRESIIPHPMLPSDAETLAGALALLNGHINKDKIDLLLVASQVPDLLLPANASLVQHKLKLPNAGAYHIDTCCSSFVTMLEIAAAMVKAGIKKNVLIAASYIDSHVNDKSDYFSVNTGDAAVAAVVKEVGGDYGYVASASTSYGSRHDGVIIQRRPPELFRSAGHDPYYERPFVTFYNQEANKEIANHARSDMNHTVKQVLDKTGLAISDIDFCVTHQPVYWASSAWLEGLGIDEKRSYNSFEKYGNIANCSAPVNLLEAIEEGKVKEGDLVLIASSGAGENYIAILERITPQLVKSLRA
jgi:3-oxoacyl-[acyl-carrier-protein] synthase-3